MREILSKEPGDTTAAAVKEIGEAGKVPLRSTFNTNPFRMSVAANIDPGILGISHGENQRFPPESRKKSRKFQAPRHPR